MPSLILVLSSLLQAQVAAPPPPKFRLVSPKPDGIIATGLNGRGDLVGFEWVEEKENPGVIGQVPFFARGGRQITLPLLKGYTATFPAAVSDDGLVVGRVGKAAPPNVRVPMRTQAFVWDEGRGIRGLGVLTDDWASAATDVSRDGARVAGSSVGENRNRACVWDREGDGWKGTALPHADRLGSQVVAMSDDGKSVAAVDGSVPCLWTRAEDGTWSREAIGGPGSLVPRAVNDMGTVAGLRYTPDGLTHAVVWARGKGLIVPEMPRGYVSSEALAINNAGIVVGWADGPHGSPIGPDPFAFEDGRVRLIDEAGPDLSSASAINDRGEIAGVVEKEEEKADPGKPKP